MKQLALINPEDVSEVVANNYPVRFAARAIVVDGDGKIALLHVSKQNYYKLPGGGIEDGEVAVEGLKRECLEEIGCDIEIKSEVGSIKEYRKIFSLTQISYCYTAILKGPKGTAHLTQEEIDNGFKVEWLEYEEAVQKLKSSPVADIDESLYILQRDIIFLEEAKKYLQTIK